jgi:hypothetical protein
MVKRNNWAFLVVLAAAAGGCEMEDQELRGGSVTLETGTPGTDAAPARAIPADCFAPEVARELAALNKAVKDTAAAWAAGCDVTMCTGADNDCEGSGIGSLQNACQAIVGAPGNCRFINTCIGNRLPTFRCLRTSVVSVPPPKDHMVVMVSGPNGPIEYIDGWACTNKVPSIVEAGSKCWTHWGFAAPAPNTPIAAPEPPPVNRTCFYLCKEDFEYGNYWVYSSFSDCRANRCDLKGQSSAGTCRYPSNLFGVCQP